MKLEKCGKNNVLLNDNLTVDQSSGNTLTITIPWGSSIVGDSVKGQLFVPFPFYSKNTSYTIEIKSLIVANVGSVTANSTIGTKARNGVYIIVNNDSVKTYGIAYSCNGSITITF